MDRVGAGLLVMLLVLSTGCARFVIYRAYLEIDCAELIMGDIRKSHCRMPPPVDSAETP